MAIASRFQPQNLAQQRFNPFYGEMGGAPWGSKIQRRTGAVQGGQPVFTPETAFTPEMTEQQRYQDLLDNPGPGWDPRMNNPDYVLSQIYNQGPWY
jgi:hypothetical protein